MYRILLIAGAFLWANYTFSNSIEKTGANNTFLSAKQNNLIAEKVILKIEKKYNIYITYETHIFDDITLSSDFAIEKTKTAEGAFNQLLKNSPLTHKMVRKDFYVIVKKVTKIGYIEPADSTRTIKGTVYDETNMPLPGANIIVKGTTNGTSTDFNGKFTIDVKSADAVLIIRFIGYKDEHVAVAGKTDLKISLTPDAIGLEEVVISGVAGKTSVKKLTVTVAKISADELNAAPSASAAGSLQSKIAGVQVIQAGGTPGSGSSIRLRGSTSITGSQSPLILVDGNILESSLADINVDDIESIEVVKGAAAASLYGSKAGSGVILVTTKRGSSLQEGKTEVKIRNQFGSSSLVKQIELSNSHPYQLSDDYADFSDFTKYNGVRYTDEGEISRGSRKLDDDHISDNPYGLLKDNQADFFSPGNYFTNYISIANRSAKSNLFMSFENNNQSGILVHTEGYKRQNFRFNADHRINEKLKISTSNLIINTQSDNPGSTGAFFDLLFLSPDIDLTAPNEDGSAYNVKPDPWSLEENPIYPLYYRDRTSLRSSILSNVIGNYEPIEWLSFNAKYTFEKQNKHWTNVTPRGYLYGGGGYIEGNIYKEEYASTFQTFQTTANLNKAYKNYTVKGKFSYLYEDKNYYDFKATGRDFITEGIPQLNNTDPEKSTISSYQGVIRAENVFGILDFDIKNRYLFSVLYRMDGSSLFGSEERWNPYYRVSTAYRITQDLTIPGIQELKFRAAYGTAGQRPGFSNQYETWNIVSGAPQRATMGNKNLKPSESEELELAIDANFLKHFKLQLSYSQTDTKDVFALAPLPSHNGYPAQWQNVGTLSSWVYEASLRASIVDNDNFSWGVNMTFDNIKQVITKLNIPEYKTGPLNAFFIKEGEPMGVIYGYKWLTSLDEMADQLQGDQSIADYVINSDGYVIPVGTEGTINEKPILWDKDANGVADLTKIGDGNPDFHMGLGTNLRWKDFQFYALFNMKQGGDIYNYTHQYTFRDHRAVEFDQAGVADNMKKTIDYYSTFYHHTALNSYFIEDASYVKLREMSIYYNHSFTKDSWFKGKVSSVKIGLTGNNLLTFTNYSGYDPEVASGSDLSNFPFDNFGYPNYRNVSASFEIKF